MARMGYLTDAARKRLETAKRREALPNWMPILVPAGAVVFGAVITIGVMSSAISPAVEDTMPRELPEAVALEAVNEALTLTTDLLEIEGQPARPDALRSWMFEDTRVVIAGWRFDEVYEVDMVSRNSEGDSVTLTVRVDPDAPR